MQARRTIYFDMDGVLAKWDPTASQEMVAAPGYFLTREPEENAISLVKKLVDTGCDVRILSSVYTDDHSEKEKTAWLEKYGLKDLPRTFVPYGEDKFQYIGELKNQILIDDFGKNLKAWRGAGLTAIKFYNGVNDRPRMEFDENGVAHIKQDSWDGISINNRMRVQDMHAVIVGAMTIAA